MRKLPAIIALTVALVSCIGVDQKLGGDFIPTDQKYDFHTAEFDLDEIWMKSIDSLTAYSSRRITIGSIRDERFGLFSRGSVVTLVPVLDSVDFGKDPVFKRFKFKAGPDSTSVADESQQNILQNVNVFALTESLSSKDYYSRAEVKHSTKRITKGVPVVNGQDSLTFEFTEDFGKQYFNITQDDLKDLATYTKKFPGIYLCTDEPAGIGGRFDMYKFDILERVRSSSGSYYINRTDNYAILYFNGEFNGERRDSSLMFYFSPVEMQDLDSLINASALPSQYVFNVDRHESDHLIGKAEDKIFIEGGSGVKPVVPASEIQRLVNEEIVRKGGNPATALISKATIELPFDFPDDYTTMFRYPKVLSPTIKISTDTTVTFAGLTDASASDENQGDINRSLCNYAPDITHHVQQIIRKDANDSKLSNYDIWFLVMWYETTTTYNAEAEEMANYYQQIAYASYYNQLYGGYGYGYGSSYYGGYGGYGSYYNNYYNYATMAQYASSSATTTTSDTELDKDRYYNAVLRGPKAEGKKPKLRVTFAIPKGYPEK